MNYENPTKYLAVALCWAATLCAFQRCPFRCPYVFHAPDNKENCTSQPDKGGGPLYLQRRQMGEAYIKAASITVKYDPSLSASVLQMAQEPFIKTRGQAHSSAVARPSSLCPGIGRWIPTWASRAPAKRCECLCGFQTPVLSLPSWSPESIKVTFLIPWCNTQSARSTRNWQNLSSGCCVALGKSLYLSVSQALS